MNRTYLVLLHLGERSLERLKPACGRVRNICLLNATNSLICPAHTCASVSLENEGVSDMTHLKGTGRTLNRPQNPRHD